jgi:hypothetical protein
VGRDDGSSRMKKKGAPGRLRKGEMPDGSRRGKGQRELVWAGSLGFGPRLYRG